MIFSGCIGLLFLLVCLWLAYVCIHIIPFVLLSRNILGPGWYTWPRLLIWYCWGVFLLWWVLWGIMTHFYYNIICCLLLWIELGEYRFLTFVVMLQVLCVLLFICSGWCISVWKIYISPLGIIYPTPWYSNTRSFTIALSKTFVLVPLMRCRYPSKLHDPFFITVLLTCCLWLSCNVFIDLLFVGYAVVVIRFMNC